MTNALLPGLGGPLGQHARARGPWFDPLPWSLLSATALYLVLVLRQVPCVQTDATDAVNAFIRLCYSDIPIAFTQHGFGLGEPAFGGSEMFYPPVLGVVVLLTVRLAAALGADISPDAPLQTQLDGAQVFYGINMVLLFAAFLAWVLASMVLGRGSRGGRVRSWDALLVASSPIVLAVGLINWDLLPIGMAAVGIALLARGRTFEAAVLVGLAAGAGIMAIGVAVAVVAHLGLGGRRRQALTFALTSFAVWVVVHVPLLLSNPGAVRAFYAGQVDSEATYGSVWFVLQRLGLDVRAAGSLGFMLLVLFLLLVLARWYVRGAQPALGTAVGVVVFSSVLLAPGFTPQTGLWLLFALVLAGPRRSWVIALTLAQLAYFLAIWGLLSGHLTLAQNGPEGLYHLAIVARVGVDGWLLYEFLGQAEGVASTGRRFRLSSPHPASRARDVG